MKLGSLTCFQNVGECFRNLIALPEKECWSKHSDTLHTTQFGYIKLAKTRLQKLFVRSFIMFDNSCNQTENLEPSNVDVYFKLGVSLSELPPTS